ncbi:addiction module protein [Pseudomonas aeruginosa]|uniref:addiction module protein n=1 Tax=Pseudomonas aeruginosa TaxID=287 RepID=UPI000EADD80B|nr:addiction module protein [Pseudomonas aeruginosa]
MARLDPALAEEIRRLPISLRLELIQALLDRAGPEVERQWLRVAEDRLADCRGGTADALPLAEMLKRLGC